VKKKSFNFFFFANTSTELQISSVFYVLLI
jgi:hypothetical protein